MPATEGVLRLQMKSKSNIPCTALACRPLHHCQLDVPWLYSILVFRVYSLDETSCLRVEEGVCRLRAQRSAGGHESLDVVVRGKAAISAAIDAGRAADAIRAVHGRGGHLCGCSEVFRRLVRRLRGYVRAVSVKCVRCSSLWCGFSGKTQHALDYC